MTTTATGPTRLSLTVDRILDAIGAGAGIPGHLLAAGIVLDATAPDREGCIARDRFFCGDAARLAEMAAADHAG